MSSVSCEAPLTLDTRTERVGHLVDRPRERADLVCPLYADPRAQLTRRDTSRRSRGPAQPQRQPARQHQPHPGRDPRREQSEISNRRSAASWRSSSANDRETKIPLARPAAGAHPRLRSRAPFPTQRRHSCRCSTTRRNAAGAKGAAGHRTSAAKAAAATRTGHAPCARPARSDCARVQADRLPYPHTRTRQPGSSQAQPSARTPSKGAHEATFIRAPADSRHRGLFRSDRPRVSRAGAARVRRPGECRPPTHTPRLREQSWSGAHDPGVAGQVDEKSKLRRRKRHRHPVAPHEHRGLIDLEASDTDQRGGCHPLGATQHRTKAGAQHRHWNGFVT